MKHIPGRPADFNDNNPVEMRGYRLLTSESDLGKKLGLPPTSRIITQPYGAVPYDPPGPRFWRYYPNGILVGDNSTCARALYGPIAEYWGDTGQFEGPLGLPISDVIERPGGSAIAIFERGVLLKPAGGPVTDVYPLPAALVSTFSATPASAGTPAKPGFDPSIEGITALAQQRIVEILAKAFATNAKLRDNVNSVTPTVTFVDTQTGRCIGGGFGSSGTGQAQLRAHRFKVLLECDLKGCAGSIGGASADLYVTIRLGLTGSLVAAILEDYHLEGISTPLGLGDELMKSAVTSAVEPYRGKNVLTPVATRVRSICSRSWSTSTATSTSTRISRVRPARCCAGSPSMKPTSRSIACDSSATCTSRSSPMAQPLRPASLRLATRSCTRSRSSPTSSGCARSSTSSPARPSTRKRT